MDITLAACDFLSGKSQKLPVAEEPAKKVVASPRVRDFIVLTLKEFNRWLNRQTYFKYNQMELEGVLYNKMRKNRQVLEEGGRYSFKYITPHCFRLTFKEDGGYDLEFLTDRSCFWDTDFRFKSRSLLREINSALEELPEKVLIGGKAEKLIGTKVFEIVDSLKHS